APKRDPPGSSCHLRPGRVRPGHARPGHLRFGDLRLEGPLRLRTDKAVDLDPRSVVRGERIDPPELEVEERPLRVEDVDLGERAAPVAFARLGDRAAGRGKRAPLERADLLTGRGELRVLLDERALRREEL